MISTGRFGGLMAVFWLSSGGLAADTAETVSLKALKQPSSGGGLLLEFSGGAGYFLAPGEVNGDRADNGYVVYGSEEETGFRNRQNTFSHPFPRSVRANGGHGFRAFWNFSPPVGFGIEFATFSSWREESFKNTLRERENYRGYYGSAIPYDYLERVILLKQKLAMRLSMIGAVISYDLPLILRPFSLDLLAGIGAADLYLIAKETSTTATEYFQNSGNKVYSDSGYTTFSAGGIDYRSWYFRPEVGLVYSVTRALFLRAAFGVPILYVENGVDWDESYGDTGYGATFFPDRRFFSADPVLTVSAAVNLWGKRKSGAER